ncbi:ABC transporter ATP-binding protein [Candidatus Roseilinea sp. NK_OTU-006]|uniref:ABC transporter ATP-binding protein n=1 Tax=Candidatus Roseilinea sp. NK_OTU-006 TaxID=2704250 RepID=UPI002A5A1AD9|nr:ABC transporter ATP-binding protein [Candidatus Roseilinea sp. NK_OTU-006]
MTSEFSVERQWRSDRRSPGRWVFSHLWRYKVYILGILIGALGNAGGAAVMPLLVGQAFNAVVAQPPDTAALGLVVVLIVLSQIVRAVLQLGRNFSSEIIGQRIERDARDELYTSLIGKSMSFHDRQSIGDIMARATNDVREVNLLMNPGVNLVVGSAAFLLFPLVIGPRIHPQLVAVPLFYVAAYAVAVAYYLRKLAPATERVRRAFGQMNATLAESIEGIETVKGAAQENREIARFRGVVDAWRAAAVGQGDVESLYLPSLIFGMTMALGLLHSLLLYHAGAISVGDVVAYNGVLMFLQFPTFATQFAYPQVSSGLASARRILELMNAETSLDENKGGYAGAMRGDVTFDRVTFRYGEDERPALQDVTISVKAGQTVAIVGQTGAGKSTLTKMINRIYDVDAGCVCVDGVDVRDWDLDALRRQISTIEQDVFLFSRTIAENIKFGCPDATQAEIEQAAKAAQAHEFILSFKDGYNTIVGERGVTLSGGQRQRIAIARAFLADPRILILDDSTSAIDSATEDLIQRAMFRVAQGRTTFLITHRLSQIRWADLIVVLKQGRVVACGSHEELMRTSKDYRAIFAGDDERPKKSASLSPLSPPDWPREARRMPEVERGE